MPSFFKLLLVLIVNLIVATACSALARDIGGYSAKDAVDIVHALLSFVPGAVAQLVWLGSSGAMYSPSKKTRYTNTWQIVGADVLGFLAALVLRSSFLQQWPMFATSDLAGEFVAAGFAGLLGIGIVRALLVKYTEKKVDKA